MTTRSYKLTGRLPVVGTDGETRWTGTVELDDEVTNVQAIVQSGGIELPDPDLEAPDPEASADQPAEAAEKADAEKAQPVSKAVSKPKE